VVEREAVLQIAFDRICIGHGILPFPTPAAFRKQDLMHNREGSGNFAFVISITLLIGPSPGEEKGKLEWRSRAIESSN
jgi:hypothetical protein